MTDERQERFKLHAPTGEGDDEFGHFDVIPLSTVQGGKLRPYKVHTEPQRHLIVESSPTPRGWYKDKHEPPNHRPRTCYTEALLTSPYGGSCPGKCRFCYVELGTRGYHATGLPTVNPQYPEDTRRRLTKMMVSGPAYITSFSEPFHRLEPTYHITQQLSQIFTDSGLPLFYLTRQAVPDWAVDYLLANPYNYLQWSINTPDPKTYHQLSPGAFDLDTWLKQADRLSDQGVYVSIQCNPLLPGIVTLDEIKHLITIGVQAGCRHFTFKFAEQVYNQRKLLMDRLSRIPGAAEFDRLFTQTIGGVYTIRQDVREEWLNELLVHTRSLGVTMGCCHEYYDNGQAGANMAPYFTTSDSCHGRGVPVHYRPAPGEPFEPIPGCYRKGCLYCEEYGTHACSHKTLLDAKALEYRDYCNIFIDRLPVALWELEESCAQPDDAWQAINGNPGQMTDAELWGWTS